MCQDSLTLTGVCLLDGGQQLISQLPGEGGGRVTVPGHTGYGLWLVFCYGEQASFSYSGLGTMGHCVDCDGGGRD